MTAVCDHLLACSNCTSSQSCSSLVKGAFGSWKIMKMNQNLHFESLFLTMKGCLLGQRWYLCHGSPWGYEISRVICLISGTEPHWKSSFLLFFLESPKPMGFARLFPWGKRIAEWRNLSKLTLVGGERDSLAPSIPSISCTSSPSHIKSTKKSIHYSNLIQLDAIWESITESTTIPNYFYYTKWPDTTHTFHLLTSSVTSFIFDGLDYTWFKKAIWFLLMKVMYN